MVKHLSDQTKGKAPPSDAIEVFRERFRFHNMTGFGSKAAAVENATQSAAVGAVLASARGRGHGGDADAYDPTETDLQWLLGCATYVSEQLAASVAVPGAVWALYDARLRAQLTDSLASCLAVDRPAMAEAPFECGQRHMQVAMASAHAVFLALDQEREALVRIPPPTRGDDPMPWRAATRFIWRVSADGLDIDHLESATGRHAADSPSASSEDWDLPS